MAFLYEAFSVNFITELTREFNLHFIEALTNRMEISNHVLIHGITEAQQIIKMYLHSQRSAILFFDKQFSLLNQLNDLSKWGENLSSENTAKIIKGQQRITSTNDGTFKTYDGLSASDINQGFSQLNRNENTNTSGTLTEEVTDNSNTNTKLNRQSFLNEMMKYSSLRKEMEINLEKIYHGIVRRVCKKYYYGGEYD